MSKHIIFETNFNFFLRYTSKNVKDTEFLLEVFGLSSINSDADLQNQSRLPKPQQVTLELFMHPHPQFEDKRVIFELKEYGENCIILKPIKYSEYLT